MQKIATRVFIYASVVFGILGIIMVMSGKGPGEGGTLFNVILTKLFFTTVFVILTSFALSVAGKYLNGKS